MERYRSKQRLQGLQRLQAVAMGMGLALLLTGCTSSSKSSEESASSKDNGPLISQRTTGAIAPFAPRDQIVSSGLYAPGSSTSVALWKTRATLGNRALSEAAEMTLELLQGGGVAETADLQLVAPLVRFQVTNSDGTTISRESLHRDIVIESIVDRFVDQNNIVALVLFNFGKTNEERWLIEAKHIQFQITPDQSRTTAFSMRDTDFVFTLGAVRPKKMPQGWRIFTPPPRDGAKLSTNTENLSDAASEVTLSWVPPDGSNSGYLIKTSYAPFESPGCVDGKAIDADQIRSARQDFPEIKSDSYLLSGLLDGHTAYIQLCSRNDRSPADVSEGVVITYEVPRRAIVTLTNAPPANTNANSLNVTVGGSDLTSYKYALLSGVTNCDNASYSNWIAVDQPVVGQLSETSYILCTIGKISDANVQKNPTSTLFQVDRTPPQSFTVTAPLATLTSRKPEIRWNQATGADSYDATIATDNGCTTIFKTLNVTTSKLSEIAIPDGTYYLCVTAKDAAGNSRPASSGAVPFTVDATPPGTFSISSPLASSTVYTHNPQISWSTASGAATYTYVVSDNSACTSAVVTEQNAANTTHVVSHLVPGPYYLCVTATDTAGNQTSALNSGLAFDVNTGSWGSVTAPGITLTNRTDPLYAWAPSYGKLMIWGGMDTGGNALSTGAMYDPAVNEWQVMSQTNALSARRRSTALWSTAVMRLLVWGGEDGNQSLLNDGAFYEPGGDWTPMASENTPLARKQHTAVLADSTMIVWGGISCSETPICGSSNPTNTGGLFHIPSNTWQSEGTNTSDPDTPSPRLMHTAVWTGSTMIIWGGSNGSSPLNTGGRYLPGAPGGWTAVSILNAPSPRHSHAAVWTGSKMLVWGGYGCLNPPTCTQQGELNDASLYDPTTDSWAPLSGSEALSSRSGFISAWEPSFQRLFVWGGEHNGSFLNDGGMISPASGWIVPRVSSVGAPSARSGAIAVWTGSKFMIFGGGNGSLLGSGATFTPP